MIRSRVNPNLLLPSLGITFSQGETMPDLPTLRTEVFPLTSVLGTLEIELSGLLQSVDCGCLSEGVFWNTRSTWFRC